MMNKEDLCVFADPEHPRMCGPFSWGDYSYATNGHLLVRVPRLASVPEWEALNESAAVLFKGLDLAALDAAMIVIPDFTEPESVPCTVCVGTGKVSICPECAGEGVVGFESDYNLYEFDCQSCNGKGKVTGHEEICLSCTGTGKRHVPKRIELGCTGFSSHYLTMLKALPGMKIAPTEPTAPNYFKWDEGDGLIMPMRF